MSRKFRPAQCPRCISMSRKTNIKYPVMILLACEGAKGYSTSHADFKGESSHHCHDFEAKALIRLAHQQGTPAGRYAANLIISALKEQESK